MSFLEEISKKKVNLKSTETVITHSDGSTFTENSEMRSLGLDPLRTENSSKKYGFVVDLKPDNIPANIIPGLHIGSQDCADESIAEKYKITHILSIGVDSFTNLDKKFVPCLDLPETCIDEVLREACAYIGGAHGNKGSVLVHCNAGVSRSAMVVIGYLILEKKYSFQEAYALVKRKRPSIQPNAGFIKQLKSLDTG